MSVRGMVTPGIIKSSLSKLLISKQRQISFKKKHIDILIQATHQRNISPEDYFIYIHQKLLDSNWVVVYKALMLIHILMREGDSIRILEYLAIQSTEDWWELPNLSLKTNMVRRIRPYSLYLKERIKVYKQIKTDFVSSRENRDIMVARIRSLPVEDGLLSEVALLQRQLNALLACKFESAEFDGSNNVIKIQAFRLLLGDLMPLFHILNEGTIHILEVYFEMIKSQARVALEVYKMFVQQTTKVMDFFELARSLQSVLQIDIPYIKHAPISLVMALQDYLNNPDFDSAREKYINDKNKPKSSTTAASSSKANEKNSLNKKSDVQPRIEPPNSTSNHSSRPNRSATTTKKELDFFASLDEELGAPAPLPGIQYQQTFSPQSNQAILLPFNSTNNNNSIPNDFLSAQQQLLNFQIQQQHQTTPFQVIQNNDFSTSNSSLFGQNENLGNPFVKTNLTGGNMSGMNSMGNNSMNGMNNMGNNSMSGMNNMNNMSGMNNMNNMSGMNNMNNMSGMNNMNNMSGMNNMNNMSGINNMNNMSGMNSMGNNSMSGMNNMGNNNMSGMNNMNNINGMNNMSNINNMNTMNNMITTGSSSISDVNNMSLVPTNKLLASPTNPFSMALTSTTNNNNSNSSLQSANSFSNILAAKKQTENANAGNNPFAKILSSNTGGTNNNNNGIDLLSFDNNNNANINNNNNISNINNFNNTNSLTNTNSNNNSNIFSNLLTNTNTNTNANTSNNANTNIMNTNNTINDFWTNINSSSNSKSPNISNNVFGNNSMNNNNSSNNIFGNNSMNNNASNNVFGNSSMNNNASNNVFGNNSMNNNTSNNVFGNSSMNNTASNNDANMLWANNNNTNNTNSNNNSSQNLFWTNTNTNANNMTNNEDNFADFNNANFI